MTEAVGAAGEAVGAAGEAVGAEGVTEDVVEEGMTGEADELKRKRKAETDAKLAEIGFSQDRFDEHGNLKEYSFKLPTKMR